MEIQNQNKVLSPIKYNEWEQIAPAVVSTKPAPQTSMRYAFIPTNDVIEGFKKEGWYPIKVQTAKKRDESKQIFSKHVIWFRKKEDFSVDKDTVIKELKVTNSHDGFSSLKVECGLHRVICGNQLSISIQDLYNISIRHMNLTEEEVSKSIKIIMKNFKFIMQRVDDYKKIKLSEKEQIELARKAIHIRFPDQKVKMDPKKVLECRRNEDSGDDLWTVYNRIQENIIKGVVYQNEKGKTRKARQIKSFEKDDQINKQLWVVLEAMRYSKVK